MKTFAFFVLGFIALAGTSCTPTQKGAAVGGAAGAALGTIIADGDNHKKGALIGGAVGAVAGAAAGKAQERRSNPYQN